VSSINTISVEQLARLVGTAKCPRLLDVRPEEQFSADPVLLPGSVRRSHSDVRQWAREFPDRSVIVICRIGDLIGHGVAAWLRSSGVSADLLEGGLEAWKRAGLPLVPASKLPALDAQGRTVWITRERPKVDRIACPWLIRRFVDPLAVFLFVKPSVAVAVGEAIQATPFDIEGAHWSHRGDRCTFDMMIEEFDLGTRPLLRLATIVRAADTARLDLAPEAAGLLAASLGLSRVHDDDHAQLESGMLLYDAFYRWCRDATAETHTSHSKKTQPRGA
jgi:rhodanese-related sulfurtransferase